MLMVKSLFYFLFVSGLIAFASKRKHFLLMLLSLEFIVLSLYLGLFLFLGCYEYFFSMVYLTVSVCEGSLGLAILVSMIRTHGNDYMLSFSSLW